MKYTPNENKPPTPSTVTLLFPTLTYKFAYGYKIHYHKGMKGSS